MVIYPSFVVPIGFMRRFIVERTPIADIGTLSLVVTASAIAGSVLLYRAVRKTPFNFLFVRPEWTSIGTPHAGAMKQSIAA